MTIKKTTLTDEEAVDDEVIIADDLENPADVTPNKQVPSPVDVTKPPVAATTRNTNDNLEEEHKFPAAFYCPITGKIMTDPVVHPDGDSYEKAAVMERQGDDSLLTFYPNRALKAYMEDELEKHEEAGSMRGTLRTWDNNIRNGWDKFVEKAALPTDMESNRPLPDDFYCTLTLDLCHEPVIDPDGYTYERQAIVHWVNNNGDSPVTRKALSVEQLYDNNAVLTILLEESEKPEEEIHPCIKRWKEEMANPQPISIVPSPEVQAAADRAEAGGISMNGVSSSSSSGAATTIPGLSSHYPTTHEEMEQRMQREHRKSMISLLLIIVIISFALVYLPFYLVVFVLAFCSCLYARRRFHERNRYGR